MQEKLLKDLVKVISGQGSEKIIDVLYKKKNVNEFLIAKKLNVTINQARNILYKLGDEGLVYFNRKKDKKSGGWYTYFWTLDVHKALLNFRERLSKEIEELEKSILEKNSQQFYVCQYCGMEVNEELALTYDFTCPECGEVFQLKNNFESVQDLEKNVSKLKEVHSQVEVELTTIVAKQDSVKARKITIENKKKVKERARKRAAKKLERENESKKNPKKAAKKVTKKSTKKATKKTVKKATKKVAKKATKKAVKKTSKKKSGK